MLISVVQKAGELRVFDMILLEFRKEHKRTIMWITRLKRLMHLTQS